MNMDMDMDLITQPPRVDPSLTHSVSNDLNVLQGTISLFQLKQSDLPNERLDGLLHRVNRVSTGFKALKHAVNSEANATNMRLRGLLFFRRQSTLLPQRLCTELLSDTPHLTGTVLVSSSAILLHLSGSKSALTTLSGKICLHRDIEQTSVLDMVTTAETIKQSIITRANYTLSADDMAELYREFHNAKSSVAKDGNYPAMDAVIARGRQQLHRETSVQENGA